MVEAKEGCSALAPLKPPPPPTPPPPPPRADVEGIGANPPPEEAPREMGLGRLGAKEDDAETFGRASTPIPTAEPIELFVGVAGIMRGVPLGTDLSDGGWRAALRKGPRRGERWGEPSIAGTPILLLLMLPLLLSLLTSENWFWS